jgi:hypothetical protein
MTESETNHLQNLTAALMQAASGATTTVDNTAKPKRRTVAQIMRPRSEEQGRCPQCGYTAPLDDFDNGDSESDGAVEGFETDKNTSKTGGDDQENALAKRLLKAAGYKPEQAAGDDKSRKQLTREEIQAILNKAVKDLRR